MKDMKVELINKSKSYDRYTQIRPRATIFRDKSKWYRPSEREELYQELSDPDLEWEMQDYEENSISEY